MYLVGLHIYYKMIHGPYNITLKTLSFRGNFSSELARLIDLQVSQEIQVFPHHLTTDGQISFREERRVRIKFWEEYFFAWRKTWTNVSLFSFTCKHRVDSDAINICDHNVTFRGDTHSTCLLQTTLSHINKTVTNSLIMTIFCTTLTVFLFTKLQNDDITILSTMFDN